MVPLLAAEELALRAEVPLLIRRPPSTYSDISRMGRDPTTAMPMSTTK